MMVIIMLFMLAMIWWFEIEYYIINEFDFN